MPPKFIPPRPINTQTQSSPIALTPPPPAPPKKTPTATTTKTATATAATASAFPTPLLARLTHDAFQQPDTRITSDAMAVLTQYIEIFAKEAVLRAFREREDAHGAERYVFVDVADLEKVVPQLVVDF